MGAGSEMLSIPADIRFGQMPGLQEGGAPGGSKSIMMGSEYLEGEGSVSRQDQGGISGREDT